jgi:hypothetical protein
MVMAVGHDPDFHCNRLQAEKYNDSPGSRCRVILNLQGD